ncbi:MAG TPA: response regulator [candidate division CPR3 bacterium]|uniref:Response regulator n=1 Tax=candidate division CPR3 bacterium TaxID=2268181 RepID=A0A7C1T294_UNCC3|nr:response regulator [candidate division CPR3 bacterium]
MMSKILLVEDDPLLIDIYTTKFKEYDFEVQVENDGAKVVEQVKKFKPDLVVLDIVLPHMDGWDILRQIRNDKQLRKTKILILSNLGQKDEVDRGMGLGVMKYLIKADYTPTQVADEIQKLLQI